MPSDMLEMIIQLETQLADFYSRIKNLPRLKETKNMLEYMEMHSYAHASMIEQARTVHQMPKFNRDLVMNYQAKLVNTVFKQILNEQDLLKVLKTLADSEEAIGYLYNSIVQYIDNLIEYYKNLSEKIKQISGEEFEHRDLILKDREKVRIRLEAEEE